jgi:hypothetical protein
MRRYLIALALIASLALAAQASGTAANDIRPPTAKVEGATLQKLTKRFFIFDGVIPVVDGSHPALDLGEVDCSIGQPSRKLWFLETGPLGNGDFERSCTVAKATTLYVPHLQSTCSPEFDGVPVDECLAGADDIHAAFDLSLTVDGVTLDDDDLEQYRTSTGEFEIPLADDNIWEVFFGTEFGESLTFGSDAIGVLVGPLSVGSHEIVIDSKAEEFGIDSTLTYHLTVVPKL